MLGRTLGTGTEQCAGSQRLLPRKRHLHRQDAEYSSSAGRPAPASTVYSHVNLQVKDSIGIYRFKLFLVCDFNYRKDFLVHFHPIIPTHILAWPKPIPLQVLDMIFGWIYAVCSLLSTCHHVSISRSLWIYVSFLEGGTDLALRLSLLAMTWYGFVWKRVPLSDGIISTFHHFPSSMHFGG